MAINKVIKKNQNNPHGSYQIINPLKAWVNEFQYNIHKVGFQATNDFFSPLTQVNKPSTPWIHLAGTKQYTFEVKVHITGPMYWFI